MLEFIKQRSYRTNMQQYLEEGKAVNMKTKHI